MHELYTGVRVELLLLEVPHPCSEYHITYTLHSVVGYYLPSTRLPHLNNALRMVILRAVDTFSL